MNFNGGSSSTCASIGISVATSANSNTNNQCDNIVTQDEHEHSIIIEEPDSDSEQEDATSLDYWEVVDCACPTDAATTAEQPKCISTSSTATATHLCAADLVELSDCLSDSELAIHLGNPTTLHTSDCRIETLPTPPPTTTQDCLSDSAIATHFCHPTLAEAIVVETALPTNAATTAPAIIPLRQATLEEAAKLTPNQGYSTLAQPDSTQSCVASSMSPEQYMKISYHCDKQNKLSIYVKASLRVLEVLNDKITHCLFVERNLPRCELRTYWIDKDGDEIDVANQYDYEAFLAQCPTDPHLHVAPRKSPCKSANQSTSTSSAPPTGNGYGPQADDPAAFVIHERVECDSCGQAPLIGFRYKCIQCPNFDLCQRCESQHKHHEHIMLRMPTENSPMVEAWWLDSPVLGDRSGRRSKRERRGEFCPFAGNANSNAQAENNDDNATRGAAPGFTGCGYSSGSSKHRRLRRRGVLSHVYQAMQDLAEGGAGVYRETPEDDAGAPRSTPSAPNQSQSNAESDAQNTARVVADVATRAAEFATKVAQQAADLTATVVTETLIGETYATAQEKGAASATGATSATSANGAASGTSSTGASSSASAAGAYSATGTSSAASGFNATAAATAPPQPEQPKKDTKTEAPNSQKESSQSAKSGASGESTSIPVTPTLEDLAQFIDPNIMKAGMQILSNFGEMFAKMMEPAETTYNENQRYPAYNGTSATYQPRKSSTSSASSNEVSTESTSSAASDANDNEDKEKKKAEREQRRAEREKRRSEKEQKKIEKEQREQVQAQKEDVKEKTRAAEPVNTVEITPVEVVAQNEESPEHSRAHSEEGDWQVIDKQQAESLNNSNAATSIINDIIENKNTNAAAAAPPQPTINFEQLSKDLKQHVENEKKRAEQEKKINAATSTSMSTSTSSNATSTSSASGGAKSKAQIYHNNERINSAVHAMMAMGFSNEGAWLTQLLESVNGNISEALDLMSPAQQNQRSGYY